MLIYQYNANILALFCERVEGLFNGRLFGLGIAHEEVLLGVRGIGDMAHAGEEEAGD